MIPASNAIDAHAQDFVVNDELLLSILKTYAQCNRPLHSLLEMRDVFNLCVLEQCVAPTNRSAYSPAPRPTPTRSPAGIISRSVDSGC